MPLRKHRWMTGKNISWYSASRTVFCPALPAHALSDINADDDAYHEERREAAAVGANGYADTLDKGVKVKNGRQTDYLQTIRARRFIGAGLHQAQNADHPQRHDRSGQPDPLLRQQPDERTGFLIDNADTVMDRVFLVRSWSDSNPDTNVMIRPPLCSARMIQCSTANV